MKVNVRYFSRCLTLLFACIVFTSTGGEDVRLPSLCLDKPTLCGFCLGQKFDPTDVRNKTEYAIFNLKEDYIARTRRSMYEFGFKPKTRVPTCTIYEMRVDKQTKRIMCVLAKCSDRDESYADRCARAEQTVRAFEGKYNGKYYAQKIPKRNENDDEVSDYTFSDGTTYHFTIKVIAWKYSCVLECDDSFIDDVEAVVSGGKPSSYYIHVAKEKRCEAEWNEIWEKTMDNGTDHCTRSVFGYEFGKTYPEDEKEQKKYVEGFSDVRLFGDPVKTMRFMRTETNKEYGKGWAWNHADATFRKLQNLCGIKMHQYYEPNQAVYVYRNKRVDIRLTCKKGIDDSWHVDLEITDKKQ